MPNRYKINAEMSNFKKILVCGIKYKKSHTDNKQVRQGYVHATEIK